MDEQSTPKARTRRRSVLRLLPTPVDVVPDEQLWVQDAPPLLEVVDHLPEPRIADLDALLRDVDALRSSLHRDLSLAATALEAGEPALAGFLVEGSGELVAFEHKALGHLDDLALRDDPAAERLTRRAEAPIGDELAERDLASGETTRPRRRLLSAAPFAAAAAVVFAFVAGVATPTATPGAPPASIDSAALASYEAFEQVALEGGSVSEISAAAERFHDDLEPLLASPLTDPAAVTHAIWLLQSERAVILAGGDSTRELSGVLREAERIVARLRAGLARRLPVPVAEVAPPEQKGEKPRQKQTASSQPRQQANSPKPTASPKPTSSPKATSSPQPSSQPSPKPSESAEPTAPPTVLPKAPPGL